MLCKCLIVLQLAPCLLLSQLLVHVLLILSSQHGLQSTRGLYTCGTHFIYSPGSSPLILDLRVNYCSEITKMLAKALLQLLGL